LPGSRHRPRHRREGPRADRRGGARGRRSHRHGRGGDRGAGQSRCDPGHRRLRVERRTHPGFSARADPQSAVAAVEHRRWAEDGDEGGRAPGQHARSLVGPRRQTARPQPIRRAGGDAGAARAHASALDHGQSHGRALHQRGRQLQRARGRLSPDGRLAFRLRQPAVLGDLRRRVRAPVRRIWLRAGNHPGLGHSRRHPHRTGRPARFARRNSGSDRGALEPTGRGPAR
jgi:hypothetical protein